MAPSETGWHQVAGCSPPECISDRNNRDTCAPSVHGYVWPLWLIPPFDVHLVHICTDKIEFSQNVFTEFVNKNICHYSKRDRTCHPTTCCVRDQEATTVPARHVRDRIFRLSPTHASVNHQILRNSWIQWIHVPFRENSIVFCHRVMLILPTYGKHQ